MIVRYSAVQFLGRFVPGLFGLLLASLLTHFLSPAEYGIYGLAAAIAQFVFLAGFGWLGLAVTRFFTANPEADRLIRPAGFVLFFLGAVALAIGAALTLVDHFSGYGVLIIGAVAGGILLAYFDLNLSYLSAAFEFRRSLWLNVTRAALGFLCAIAVAIAGGGGLEVFLGSCAGILLATPFFRRARPPRGAKVDPALVLKLVQFGFPLAASMALLAVAGWADRLVLEGVAGAAAVGYYSATTVLVQNTVQTLGSAVGSVALPLVVRAHERGGETASRAQFTQNLVILLGCLVPAGLGLAAIAPNLAEVLIGPEFRQQVVMLTPIVAATAIVNGVRGNFIDHFFHVSRQTGQFFWIALGAVVVNLASLALLVPTHGAIGAAAAGLITATTAFCHAAWAARRSYRIALPIREIAKLAIAAVAMIAVLETIMAHRGPAALLVQVLGGAAVFAVAAFCLNFGNLRGLLLVTRNAR
jgi:O-antigen/teichoic acid export membrane protein